MEYKNWDYARMILSENFTVSIGDRREEVESLARNIDNLEAYDYKFATWDEFLKADVPAGLIERAKSWIEPTSDNGLDYENHVSFVVFDPLDDEDGYLLIGNDALELSQEVCDFIASGEPSEGPLSTDNFVMKEIENA